MVYDLEELDHAMSLSPGLRRAMFWDRVAEESGVLNESHFLRVPKLSSADLPWLIKDADDPELPFEKRRMAFETALVHWSWKPDEEADQLNKLRAVAAHERSLQEYLERAADYRRQTREQQSREEAERENAKQRRRAANVEQLRLELEGIRSGKQLSALSWRTMNFAREKSASHKLSSVSWRTIGTELDEDIADAAREGAIAFWRTWRPPLPHELSQNQIPNEVLIGLSGISGG